MQGIFQSRFTDSRTRARVGTLVLPHGSLDTPTFMPVGTNGTVKAMLHSAVESIGYSLILANTYHLYLRPGLDVIRNYGSLHDFSGWNQNILTDSGGFQIFSLSGFRKIRPEGVTFRSHIDGSYHSLTPENIVEAQMVFNSDIAMCLDVCTPPDLSEKKALEAMVITHDWALRSLEYRNTHPEYGGSLFGIVQGNFFRNLRKESARFIAGLDFPGIAIGGLSVGEPFALFQEMLSWTVEHLSGDRPLYVMGIGTPEYILEAVEQGIDLFDCVYATRTARNGSVFTSRGMLNLKKSYNSFNRSPIEPHCTCSACRRYSRGYLRHLFKTNEILGPMLATEHNLTFLHKFLQDIRGHISLGTFSEFKRNYLEQYAGTPEE